MTTLGQGWTNEHGWYGGPLPNPSENFVIVKIGEGNWIYGIYKKLYFFAAKVYNGGSEFGINQGRVSKLEVKRFSHMWYENIPWNEVGETLYNYDRGEDVDHPIGAEIAQFLDASL